MEQDDISKTCAVGTSDDIDSRCAVNSLILDYYKKFGRKRDLEQYFSLSTVPSDIKDTSGTFWRKMKSENDSSDSGGRKSDSPQEVCRISIRCSLPEPSSSQDDDPKTKTDSPQTESPPIIIEELPADVSRHTDDDSVCFDDNNSQKSFDALLDLSAHKRLSPTSSITSQRKLEWDSLADVGYGNESDRKTSASSLSTLERLALKQQYSNNDSKQDIGQPTSHSTPLDENDSKSKAKKGLGKKTTKIYKKDVDFVEVNVPHASDTNQAPSINVNLTKHISFNVEKNGGITIDNIKRDVNVSPEKVSETMAIPQFAMDKEIQTSLTKDKSLCTDKSIETSTLNETPKPKQNDPYNPKIPVMISLNTIRKRLRKKKSRIVRRKLRSKRKIEENKDVTPQEKSGEQLSEAESFEYMPGHMYNPNQMKDNQTRPDNSTAGNKSSLESSDPLTTDSSKGSKHSLTKDLEKCFDLLKVTLQQRYDDDAMKKKLIKDIVHRLVQSRYRDDESAGEFLSGLSFNSKKIDSKGNNTTTSTSDANNTEDDKQKRPRKSILRTDKFNANVVASTSQSVPNLFTASTEKTNLIKTHLVKTESDASSKGKTSSDNAFPITSSEELYLKYLEALRREQAYKRHLKDKEMFLKQKLVSSDTAFKVPIRQEPKISSRLKDLMKDLTRNNYDDGSGDASKLEGGSTSNNIDFERFRDVRNQRNHSVFTLSSSHSEGQKRSNLKKKMQAERELGEPGPSKNHYCCCPQHYVDSKVGYSDSSVQVNIKYQCEDGETCQTKSNKSPIMPNDLKKSKPESPRHATRVVPDSVTGEIKYVCLCSGKPVSSSDVGDNFMIYKCSKLTNRGVQLEDPTRIYNTGIQCGYVRAFSDDIDMIQLPCKLNSASTSISSDKSSKARKFSRSSQTNILTKMMSHGGVETNYTSGSEGKNLCGTSTKVFNAAKENICIIHEATRCLQTEISINPRISDPTISDISIVTGCDCAKLIAEQTRQVIKNKTEKSGDGKTYSDGFTCSVSDKFVVHKSDNNILREERKCCTTCSEGKKRASNELPTVTVGKEYALPIQGTDMTLMVNVGAMQISRIKEKIDEGVVTDKPIIVDEATSINAECTKSAQFPCSSAFDHNSNKLGPKTKSYDSPRKSYVAEYASAIIPKSNTYPKNDPVIKERSPFKRSNTDTDVLSICSCVQTEPIKMDAANNIQQVVICGNLPITKIVNCENACQVDKSEESGPLDKEKFKDLTRRTCEYGCQVGKGPESGPLEEEIKVLPRSDYGTQAMTQPNNKIKTCEYGCQVEANPENEFKILPAIGSLIQEIGSPLQKQLSCQTDTQDTEDKLDIPVVFPTRIGQDSETAKPMEEVPKTEDFSRDEKEAPTVVKEAPTVVKEAPTVVKEDQNEKEEDKNKEKEIPNGEEDNISKRPCCSKESCPENLNKDPIVDMIQDITRRYSKKDIGKIKKKKCFTEIMTVLNYLLDTEDSTDHEPKSCCSTSTSTKLSSNKNKKTKKSESECCPDKLVDKSVQMSCRKSRSRVATESSDLPCSSDLPTTSTDSAACKILRKIRKECDKYHQKRCKGNRKCEVSSSTSVNCEKCKKVHHCPCKNHKCKRTKMYEKLQKKCIAYNLIIQTSESMLSEEMPCDKKCRPLQNIVVKVPKRKDHKKDTCKMESRCGTPRYYERSKSCPNECESTDECGKAVPHVTVREYLETNRPDFVEKTSQRQHCLKYISERRASERAAHRDLLSLHVEQQPDLTTLSSDELRKLAQQIGLDIRKRKLAPKFISEREMKQRSEKIYKTLPEVVQKKEEKKKENIKKTNLLMANIFKKNLQKQALRGSVNLSNYSTVIKI